MTALALPAGLSRPQRKPLWMPRFEPWRLLRPLRMDGQWLPRQPLHLGDGLPATHGIPHIEYYGGNGATASSSLTLSNPLPDNGLIILRSIAWNNGSYPSSVSPSGYTQVSNNTLLYSVIVYVRCQIWVKAIDAGDPGDTLTLLSGSYGQGHRADYWTHRGKVTPTPSAFDYQATFVTGDPAQQTCSVAGQTKPMVLMALAQSPTVTGLSVSPSMTTITNDASLYRGYTIYNSLDTPANQSIDAGDGGDYNILQVFGVTL